MTTSGDESKAFCWLKGNVWHWFGWSRLGCRLMPWCHDSPESTPEFGEWKKRSLGGPMKKRRNQGFPYLTHHLNLKGSGSCFSFVWHKPHSKYCLIPYRELHRINRSKPSPQDSFFVWPHRGMNHKPSVGLKVMYGIDLAEVDWDVDWCHEATIHPRLPLSLGSGKNAVWVGQWKNEGIKGFPTSPTTWT